MEWKKQIEIMVKILEDPDVERFYINLYKFYINENMQEKAESIQFLINKKFKNDNNTNIN